MYKELIKEFGEPNSTTSVTSINEAWSSWENELYILTINNSTERITIFSVALNMLCYSGTPKTIELLKQIINSII